MDCFPDFCLACDKQTMEGFYCSQACRLADLEKAGSSAPTSPSTSTGYEGRQHNHSIRASGFSLPSGFDFHAPKSSTDHAQYHHSSGNVMDAQKERILSPSTSRSSLASNASMASQAMSEQTQHELNNYVSSFDAIREMKRRSLSSISSQ